MARLSQHAANIGVPVLKVLERNKILTVFDFIDEDPDKICNLSGLSFKAVADIRRDIISKFAVKSATGLDIYNSILSKAAKISTGIKCLDQILEGGFLTGNIYEVCGLSGEGKTQVCFTVATHISLALKQNVHFVDTKHDFSALRIKNMLQSQRCNDVEIQSAMQRIQVTKIEDIYQLITFLHNLGTTFADCPCRMIIIDSLPVLVTPLICGSNKDGFGLLNHVAQVMKQISEKFQIVFLVVNLALMPFDAEDTETQKPGSSETSVETEISFMGDLKPGLGKAWQHSPSYRLLIQRLGTLNSSQRLITLVKSTDIESGKKCIVEVNDSGVMSVSV